MLSTFVPFLRESLECALLLGLAASYPAVFEQRRGLLAGLAAAAAAGALAAYVPSLASLMPGIEQSMTLRYIIETLIFYSGLIFLVPWAVAASRFPGPLVFILGFFIFFFEARSLALYLEDMALIDGGARAYAGAALGAGLGFLPLVLMMPRLQALGIGRVFTPASLMIALGSLKIITGGMPEVEEGNILMAVQQGMQYIVEHGVDHLQALLMITQHPFMHAPLEGLADYLREERMSTALTAAFVTVPPVLALVRVFSRPDPEVRGVPVPAERRLRIAFFRRDMALLASPLLVSFVLLLISLHAVSASVNPLSEPEPIPVMESEARPGMLVIPLVDRLGDFTDGRLRKYVFYAGDKRIIFLAIMKPDSTVGLALDECEICKPAEWNTSALGYAQRGDHLVCKYCMSPIAIPTVNEPGGCNPIPVPFEIAEDNILLRIEDLARVHEAARKLEKRGTHF